MPMLEELYFDSCGQGKIRYCRWLPQGQVRAVVQIIHGIAEHAGRYDHFARYLTDQGIAVVAEDHMGHGKSMEGGTQGYFEGGWFAAVADSVHLLELTREQYPEVPYFLLGHSMGSFMARTILAKHPELPLSGAIISGTGWMSGAVLAAGKAMCSLVCRRQDPKKPSDLMQKLVFGGYNRKVEHPRTASDWLSRDDKVVDAYEADPLCGFPASAALLGDMLEGMIYIQKQQSLAAMNKQLPVYFIAGGDDPVGNYGSGVRTAAEKFRRAGMESVAVSIYPLCRHEVLNEINKEEVYEDVRAWLEKCI